MPNIQNVEGFSIDFDAIAAGWLRIIAEHMPEEDYACLKLGMLPADLFKNLVESLEMKIAKECLIGAGLKHPTLELIAKRRMALPSRLLTKIENGLAVAVITAATESGICSV